MIFFLDAIYSHKYFIIKEGGKEPIHLNFIKQHGSSELANVILELIWIIAMHNFLAFQFDQQLLWKFLFAANYPR